MLQERDRKIAQLTQESKDVPARKMEIEARLSAQQESLHHAQEELKKKTAATRQLEGDIDGLKQKISRFREQQFQIKSNDGYKALEKEIHATEIQIRAVEDQELALMEEMDQHRKVIAERESDLKRESQVVQQDVAVLEKRAQVIDAEIREVKADRAALAKDIQPDWLRRYERIFQHVHDFALVPVANGACGGCHMNLPPQVVSNAKRSLDLTLCDFCGRMLYWQP